MKLSKLIAIRSIKLFKFFLQASLIGSVVLPARAVSQHKVPVAIEQIAVGKNADGRLEIFANCGNYGVFHKWQSPPNGDWGDWTLLSGYGGIKQIAIGEGANGRLYLFGLGTNEATYVLTQKTPNGNWPDTWSPLNGKGLKQIAVGKGANGTLYLFGLGTNEATYVTWQKTPDGDWMEGWSSLNGGGLKQIAVGKGANGALYVFGLGTNEATYITWQKTPDGDWMDGWSSLNGGGLTQIAAGNGANGTSYVFGLGTNEATYVTWQKAPDSDWMEGWSSINGGGLKQITAGNGADGTLYVFGLGTNEAAYVIWQKAPNGDWMEGWSSLGGGLKQLTAINYLNGALALFGLGDDGQAYQTWQTSPNGDWTSSWTSMGNPVRIVTCSQNEHWDGTRCVPIPPPKIIAFEVEPAAGVYPGENFTISWEYLKQADNSPVDLLVTKQYYQEPELPVIQVLDAPPKNSINAPSGPSGFPKFRMTIRYRNNPSISSTSDWKTRQVQPAQGSTALAPFLAIYGPETNPDMLVEKTPFSVSYKFANAGSKALEAFDVNLMIDNVKEGDTKTVHKLQPNEAVTLQWDVTKEVPVGIRTFDLIRVSNSGNLGHSQLLFNSK